MALLRRALAACAVLCVGACSGGSSPAARRLPDARLPTLGGVVGPSLATCPTEKCLTILVAPWCGVCRAEAPNFVALRHFLDARGISSRVVVGLSDDLPAIKTFAAVFGADALLDADGAMSSRTTPLLLVTDREGRVLKALEGFPSRISSAEELAKFLGLI
ncbi:MAG: TlpA family protein disulfide reductase [Elusimicrobiota bacterium]